MVIIVYFYIECIAEDAGFSKLSRCIVFFCCGCGAGCDGLGEGERGVVAQVLDSRYQGVVLSHATVPSRWHHPKHHQYTEARQHRIPLREKRFRKKEPDVSLLRSPFLCFRSGCLVVELKVLELRARTSVPRAPKQTTIVPKKEMRSTACLAAVIHRSLGKRQ